MNLRSVGSYLLMILFVMIGIFAVKWAAKKWNVPVVSTIAEGV